MAQKPGKTEQGLFYLWWIDDGDRPLADKIRTAARYCRDKYGVSPNLCLVPDNAPPKKVGRIVVKVSEKVPKHGLWLTKQGE